jgi:hypothetical protein
MYNEETNARNFLSNSIKSYMQTIFHDSDVDTQEKMIAGVMAFMQVNYYKEPYLPFNFEIIEDIEKEKKKWWQFWK